VCVYIYIVYIYEVELLEGMIVGNRFSRNMGRRAVLLLSSKLSDKTMK
jgi:hypothetical protein